MSARYTTAELLRLAQDRGPFAVENMRQALTWAAHTLKAADAAVTAERERAEAALAERKPLHMDEKRAMYFNTPGHEGGAFEWYLQGIEDAECHHGITPTDPSPAGRTSNS